MIGEILGLHSITDPHGCLFAREHLWGGHDVAAVTSSDRVLVPARRIQVISAETARRKQQSDDGVAGIVAMPASLARLGVAWAWHAAGTHIDLYVTNVPGPPVPSASAHQPDSSAPRGRAWPARADRVAPLADRRAPACESAGGRRRR